MQNSSAIMSKEEKLKKQIEKEEVLLRLLMPSINDDEEDQLEFETKVQNEFQKIIKQNIEKQYEEMKR